ncbi:MAG: FmdB family zinc ribbon protein [Phycisphaerae bacterium]
MPTYEYVATDPKHGCERCRAPFEVKQSMHDPPLKKCPQCGGPVERLISRCAISTRSVKSMLSDKNLKEKGFTKLVKEDEGRYRKVT